MSGSRIVNLLRPRRERAGLSQLALAERVGVSRQALSAIEAGRQVPSTGLALELAAALACRVDDLFQLAQPRAVQATLAPPGTGVRRPPAKGARVALACVAERWVAHLLPDDARQAADGLLLGEASGAQAHVEPLADLRWLERHVLVAGCAPPLGILAQRVTHRFADARVTWLPDNSRRALELLDNGLVHVAGLHLHDADSGQDNLPIVSRRFRGRRMQVVNLTRWRQGLVVARGNPLGLRAPSDLMRRGVRFAGREKGAGAEELARRLLAASGGASATALPKGPAAAGHEAVAQLIACGAADAGVAIEGAALARGLDFVPWSEERFDLVLPADASAQPQVARPIERLIELLSERAYRSDVAQLAGYDHSLCGQIVTVGGA